MGFADSYFKKFFCPEPIIIDTPSGLLNYIVAIPAYLEESVLTTLESIRNTSRGHGDVEVLIHVNGSETDHESQIRKNLNIFFEIEKWSNKYREDHLRYYPLLSLNLSKKHAGAGLARKIVMDEAVHRFNRINNPEGVIISLDADTLVQENYFTEIEKTMRENLLYAGFVMRFEHPVEGSQFSPSIYEAIIMYELYLRYFRNILHYTGFPYAKYTLGSCFGVRAGFYTEQGGMNRRQAGEDFYFLHKLFPHRPFAEITSTCVFPSPRISDRVPFGTGPSVASLISNKQKGFPVYSPDAFITLGKFFQFMKKIFPVHDEKLSLEFHTLPDPIQEFLLKNDFFKKVKEIYNNTSSAESFLKRFFCWFNGLKVIRYLNDIHPVYYGKIPLKEAVLRFWDLAGIQEKTESLKQMLEIFRKADRGEKDWNLFFID